VRQITQTEYHNRRQKLMAQMPSNSIAIIGSSPIAKRNGNLEYPYRPDSNFYYLSGFNEPDALLVLAKERNKEKYVLFCRERNIQRELWEGRRFGHEGAIDDFGADAAFIIDIADKIVPNLMSKKTAVYYAIGADFAFNQKILTWAKNVMPGTHPPHSYVDLAPILAEMRLIKSAAEIAVMQTAAEISAQAHIKAMQAARPNMYEYELEAELDYHFRKSGAKFCAYNSIVAAGANACTLHYTANCAQIKNGDLVLIDAGCEIDCYASDITRTFPVNGKFSPEQLAIYEIVLAANLAAIAQVKAGVCYEDIHQISLEVIIDGLLKLGLLQGTITENLKNHAYEDFYMHKVGHWLGLDVHDVGTYKVKRKSRQLQEGMVLTIEPGIYISPDNQNVEPKWRGIGVRIEDDIVVTKNGGTVITSFAPKNPQEIEQLML